MVANGYTVYDATGGQWWVMTCNGDLRGTVVFRKLQWRLGLDPEVFRLQSAVELAHSLMGLEPATCTSEALMDQYLHSS